MKEKALKVLKMLADKKFLASLFGLIAIAVPASAQWFAINQTTLMTSISVISTVLFGILALLIDSPKQVDAKLKGGNNEEKTS